MQTLLLGTRNRGKVREIESILADSGWSFSSLQAFPDVSTPDETSATYAENAILKARFYAEATGMFALADDSGLEVDALSGAPGVFSARYAGDNASDEANVQKLLGELAKMDRENKNRSARVRCVIAIARAGRVLGTFTGTVEGIIVPDPRGAGGFGYDPVFVPDGFDRTFAELSAEIKNGISHRARAFQAAMPFLRAVLQAS